MTCLDQGIHYYRSRRYDDAIQFFSLVEKKEEPSVAMSEIHLWLGKCYFEKQEERQYSYRAYHTSIKYRMEITYEGPIKYTHTYRRMTKTALNYFNSAIKHNNSLAEAHYWKGKALQYEGKIDDAYKSYINAARLSEDRRFLAKCVSLFGSHENLPFLEVRDIDTISTENAIAALSADNVYTRMEGCLALSSQFDRGELTSQIVNQIRLRVSALAGYKLFCCYLPCTGDDDLRIKTIARSILRRTEASTKSCCSFLLGNYQAIHSYPMGNDS